MKLNKKIESVLKRISTSNLNFFEEQFRYGHREILLNYSLSKNVNLKTNSILAGGLEHGWAPGALRWVLRKRNLTYAYRYIWHERRLINYRKKENAIAVGAPWLYMLSDLGLDQKSILDKLPKRKDKVVIFPSHHTLVPVRIDIISELHKFKNRISKDSEVIVCLFWLDFCNPIIREEIEKMGWNVFSAGIVSSVPYHDTSHGGRPNFLLELFSLLKDAELIVVSGVGTAMFYGLSLGAKVQYIQADNPIDHWGLPDTGLQKINIPGFYDSNLQWLKFNIPEIFKTEQKPEQFIKAAWEELGVKSYQANINSDKFNWISCNVNQDALLVYQNRLTSIKAKLIRN